MTSLLPRPVLPQTSGWGYDSEPALTVFPYDGTSYVDCPRDLFYWFVGESQRMFWDYVDSLTEAELEETFGGYEYSSQPDKLDGCIDAYEWLRDPSWVTPDFFLVDVTALGRRSYR